MSKRFLYPLRKLHGRAHEWRETQKQGRQIKKNILQCSGKGVMIPGTPNHTNLGDSAIVLAQSAFLEKCGFGKDSILQISLSEYCLFRKIIQRALKRKCLITQLGGGNMGSQWEAEENLHRQIVLDFPENPMIIFPQTIYYDEEAKALDSVQFYNGKSNLTIVAREQTSFEMFSNLYPQTRILLTPDIVLSADMETFGVKPQTRSGVLLCMRNDAEKRLSDDQHKELEQLIEENETEFRYTDTHCNERVTKENRLALVREKLEELASARLVITDRLHGMVFAAIVGTPCIALGNYNHKVKGTYEWIKYLPYIHYAESVEEAKELFPQLLEMQNCKYDNAPLRPYFDQLAQEVKAYAED